jgi:transcription termination factor Rho
MALIKRLKNNTGSTLNILTQPVTAGNYLEIQFRFWLKVANDIQTQDIIYTQINDGTLVVNDGTSDLSLPDGLAHLQKFDDSTATGKKTHYIQYQQIGQRGGAQFW